MKNNIIIYVLLFTIILSSTSCEDYLREENYSSTTGASLVTTEQGMESMIKACYSCLRLWYGKEESILLTEAGTDIYTGGNHYISSEFVNYSSSLNGSSPVMDTYWKYFYFALNTLNSALEYLPQSVLSDEKKITREGEVRFIRSVILWHIAEIWGDAPFTEKVYRSKVLTATKMPVDSLYLQIFEDLNIAEGYLDGVETLDDEGRVSVWAVRAMLARMYLFREDYVNAKKYADMVIANTDFELAPSAAELWNIDNDEYNSNHEIIWSVNYAETGEPDNFAFVRPVEGDDLEFEYWPERHGNNLHLQFLCYYQSYNSGVLERDLEYGRAWVRFMPTLFLLDLYDETIDTRFKEYFREVYYCNKENTQDYEVGIDTVIYFSKDILPQAFKDSARYLVLDRADMWDLETEEFHYDRNFYFSLNKFLDPTRADKEDAHSGRNVFVFRLSEMYFIAGEAALYTDDAATAYPYFLAMANTRAIDGQGAEMLETYGVTSDGSGLDIDFVLDEKGREFCGENMRWFDLKRTGKLLERVRLHNPDAASIQDYHLVRPIPQSQLDAVINKDEFTQNPGYH